MKVRSLKGMRRLGCPSCGRHVLCDDAALTIRHEDPICEGFERKMRELGLQPITVERTVFIKDE